MVSLVTVVHRYLEDASMLQFGNGRFRFWEDILLDSIERYASSVISEIIIVYVTKPHVRERTHVGNIPIRRIELTDNSSRLGHSCGLHAGLEVATGEYVMFCDPDVFFLSDVPQFYIDVVKNLGLFSIGVSHHVPQNQAYETFPCVVNFMMRRDQFPPSNWLNGCVVDRYPGLTRETLSIPGTLMDGKWLVHGPPVGYWDQFPLPSGLFDVGCNLWLWNKQNAGKWLSFGGSEINNHARLYIANNYHTNFTFTSPWGQKLLYHKTANGEDADFIREYLRL